MKLLAIDTSSLACSVALQCDSQIVERHEERPKEHTRILMPMIKSVLSDSAIDVDELDAIVLGNGPGSFIGLRIAASVAQGLAYGAELGIAPVSSLAAVAAQAFAETDADEAVIAQDAHVNEVYLGVYRRGPAGLPEPVFPERLHGQSAIVELDQSGSDVRVAAGFGWHRYPGLAELNASLFGLRAEILYPRARFLLPLGAVALAEKKLVEPQDIMPAYLRNDVAKKPPRFGP